MYLDRDELWVFCHRPFSSAPFIRMKLGLREREWAHRHFLPTADGSAQIGWFALSSRLQTQGGGAEVAGLRPRGRPARRTLLLLAFGSIAGCPTRRSASRNPSFACWVGVAAVIQHVPIQSDFNLERRKAPLFSFFNDCSVCTNKEEDLNTFMSAFQLSCTSAKELFKKGCFGTKELCDAPQPQTPHATPAVHLFGWLGSSKSPSNRWMLSALLAKKHLFCWFRENLPELQTGSFRFLLQLLQLQTFSWKWTILKNTSLKLQIPFCSFFSECSCKLQAGQLSVLKHEDGGQTKSQTKLRHLDFSEMWPLSETRLASCWTYSRYSDVENVDQPSGSSEASSCRCSRLCPTQQQVQVSLFITALISL